MCALGDIVPRVLTPRKKGERREERGREDGEGRERWRGVLAIRKVIAFVRDCVLAFVCFGGRGEECVREMWYFHNDERLME